VVRSGWKWKKDLYLYSEKNNCVFMTTFIGDYPCKIDAKGRISLPSGFKKQMSAAGSVEDSFVVKKDIFERCPVLYPMNEWKRQNEIMRIKLNPYSQEHNKFLREFHRGEAEVTLDSNNRLLIPKRLLDIVEIKSDVVLAGLDSKIEIWAKERYDAVQQPEEDFGQLAEKIMAGLMINDGQMSIRF
jgi:MraZ protein